MARVTSQTDVHGAESAPFAADFAAFSLHVGVLDLVQSTASGSARRIGGDSGGGACPRLGSDAGFARQSPRPKGRAGLGHERIKHWGYPKGRARLPEMKIKVRSPPSLSLVLKPFLCVLARQTCCNRAPVPRRVVLPATLRRATRVVRPKSSPRVRHEKTRRPVRRMNPALWLFQMASVTSQSGDQGADSALFALVLKPFLCVRPGGIDRLWPGASFCRRLCGERLGLCAQSRPRESAAKRHAGR